MFAVIDVETTGNQYGNDKITEIAIIVTDGEKIISEFQTLINPNRSIDPFVEKLTGITNAMVQNEKPFEAYAEKIFSMIQGHHFVAHNVSFDFPLVDRQLAAAGFHLNVSQIDTIAYARRIVPGLLSYSLGNLCDAIGISHTDRHRAYGDTLATAELLHFLIARDEEKRALKSLLSHGLDENCIPQNLTAQTFLSLSPSPGLFTFRRANGDLIFIEATKNVRKKAIEKIQQLHAEITDKELFHDIVHVEEELTGTELMAKLFKQERVLKEKPLVGKLLKNPLPPYFVVLAENTAGVFQLKVVNRKDADGFQGIPFTSKSYANKTIDKLMKLNGLHAAYAQVMMEQDERLLKARRIEYNLRLENVLLSSTYRYPNMIVIDKGIDKETYAVLWIENGQYKGRAYISADTQIDKNNISEIIEHREETAEAQKLIRNYLKKAKVVKLIRY